MGILARLNPSGHALAHAQRFLSDAGSNLSDTARAAMTIAFPNHSFGIVMAQTEAVTSPSLFEGDLPSSAQAWADAAGTPLVERAALASELLAQSSRSTERQRAAY